MLDTRVLIDKLTPESLQNWLAELEWMPAVEKIAQMNKVIAGLLTSDMEAQSLFRVSNRLLQPALLMASTAERQSLAVRSDASQDRNGWSASQALHWPKMLMFLYAKIAAQPLADEADRLLCHYRSVQLAALLVRRNFLFRASPDLTLWKNLGEIYQEVGSRKWGSRPVDAESVGLTRYPCIEAAFKHILLFQVACSYLLSQQEMLDIFSTSGRLSPLVTLDKNASEACPFQWNTEDQFPPLSDYQDFTIGNTVYLNTAKLVAYLESHGDEKPVKQLIDAASPRLTGYRSIIRSGRPSAQLNCGLITGQKQMSRFLMSLVSRYRILELSGGAKSQSAKKKLELVPFEVMGEMGRLDEKSLAVSNVRLFVTDSDVFYTAKLRNSNYAFGELVLLLVENKKPQFAVLRHIRNESSLELANVLIEVIKGDAYPFEYGSQQGFLIVEETGEMDLLLPPTVSLGVGGEITEKGGTNRSFRIEAFVELTGHFSRYRVVAVEDKPA